MRLHVPSIPPVPCVRYPFHRKSFYHQCNWDTISLIAGSVFSVTPSSHEVLHWCMCWSLPAGFSHLTARFSFLQSLTIRLSYPILLHLTLTLTRGFLGSFPSSRAKQEENREQTQNHHAIPYSQTANRSMVLHLSRHCRLNEPTLTSRDWDLARSPVPLTCILWSTHARYFISSYSWGKAILRGKFNGRGKKIEKERWSE